MPEATGVPTDLPAPLPAADSGNVAGRKPEATGVPTDLPAPLPAADSGNVAGRTPDLAQRVQAQAEGLRPMIATAEAVQEARAKAHGAPRWTDVFTTQFTEFSNRPR